MLKITLHLYGEDTFVASCSHFLLNARCTEKASSFDGIFLFTDIHTTIVTVETLVVPTKTIRKGNFLHAKGFAIVFLVALSSLI